MAAKPQLLNVPGLAAMSEWFRWKLYHELDGRGVDPNCVVAMIAVESGFSPHIVNPIGAAGLIQVLPSTAMQAYGYSASEIAAMSPEDQLEKVILKKKWPGPNKDGEPASCGTIYLNNFIPEYTHDPGETILGDKSGAAGSLRGGLSTKSVYLCNSSGGCKAKNGIENAWSLFDPGKTGIFTVSDVKNFMNGKVGAWETKYGYLDVPELDAEPPRPPSDSSDSSMLLAGGVVAAGIAFALWRWRKGKT